MTVSLRVYDVLDVSVYVCLCGWKGKEDIASLWQCMKRENTFQSYIYFSNFFLF